MHLLKIEEICHLDEYGKVLWKNNNINNIFHNQGEQFLLNICFNTSAGIVVPSNYYLGLDNRATPALSDTLSNLSQEPTQFGYSRQLISSVNGFTVALNNSGNYQATGNVVVFNASGGSWGPIQNLFLATTVNNTGYLISTAALGQSKTLSSGQSITMRISLSLQNV